MADKSYLVTCKTPEIGTQSVVAATWEVHGECLVFLNSEGELAAMFLLEIVECWSVTYTSKCAPERASELVEWGDSEQAEFADR
jgi:hypothetical protein